MLERLEQQLRLSTQDDDLLLPFLWLRDNCQCDQCYIEELGEKTFSLAKSDEVALDHAELKDGAQLAIIWKDGHRTSFDLRWLRRQQRREHSDWLGWKKGGVLPEVDYDDFVGNDCVAASVIEQLSIAGALLVRNTPGETGTMESLQPRLGPIREVVFGRLHTVAFTPNGYNIALTQLALPPHSDLASMTYPPSLQGLHMIENQCSGGESILVDGWAVAESLRADHPNWFQLLCDTPVPFRIFDKSHETRSYGPMIELDSSDRIRCFRFSNQTMQAMPLSTDNLQDFYKAYAELSKRILSPEWQHQFRLNSGDLLLVHNHRVLHGRTAFQPEGARHLEDAYFDWENCMAHRVVLERDGRC